MAADLELSLLTWIGRVRLFNMQGKRECKELEK